MSIHINHNERSIMGEIFKLGQKGRHLEVLDGWYVLKPNDTLRPTDRVANLYEIKWELVGEEDAGMKVHIYNHVIRES